MRILTETEIKRPGLAHFIKAEYLRSFLDGNLSLAHAPSFRKGGQDPGGRFDADEGFISIGNASNTRMWVGIETTPGVLRPISECEEITDLVGQQKIQTGDDAQIHIFCVSAFDSEQIDKRIDLRMARDRDFVLNLKHVA